MIFLTHMLRSRSWIILYSIDSSDVDAQSTPLKVSGLHRHEVMFMDMSDNYFSDWGCLADFLLQSRVEKFQVWLGIEPKTLAWPCFDLTNTLSLDRCSLPSIKGLSCLVPTNTEKNYYQIVETTDLIKAGSQIWNAVNQGCI